MSRFSYLDSISRKQKSSVGKFDAWIHSKIVLYVVLAASLFQLFILANSGNYKGAISFVIVAAVMFFFSKNMVVVLVSALAVSALIGIIPGYSLPKEGMEDGTESESKESEKSEDSDKKDKKDSNKKAQEAKEDSKVIADLKRDGESLIKTQEVIMNNFKKISPELDKVESLVSNMNETAELLNSPEIKKKLSESMITPPKK